MNNQIKATILSIRGLFIHMLLMVSSALRHFKVFCTAILAPSSLPHGKASCVFCAANIMGDFLVMVCDVHNALQNKSSGYQLCMKQAQVALHSTDISVSSGLPRHRTAVHVNH